MAHKKESIMAVGAEVGAIAGTVIGGPIGTAIGSLAGGIFDTMLGSVDDSDSWVAKDFPWWLEKDLSNDHPAAAFLRYWNSNPNFVKATPWDTYANSGIPMPYNDRISVIRNRFSMIADPALYSAMEQLVSRDNPQSIINGIIPGVSFGDNTLLYVALAVLAFFGIYKFTKK